MGMAKLALISLIYRVLPESWALVMAGLWHSHGKTHCESRCYQRVMAT